MDMQVSTMTSASKAFKTYGIVYDFPVLLSRTVMDSLLLGWPMVSESERGGERSLSELLTHCCSYMPNRDDLGRVSAAGLIASTEPELFHVKFAKCQMMAPK